MPIDILFMIGLGYGFIKGFSNGIISTLFNVAAYLFGITLAFKVTPTTTNLMEIMFNSTNPMMYIGAFLVNILVIMFIMRMVAKSLETMFRAAYLGIVNQALGALVMGAFSILVTSILVWFMVKAQFLNDETIAESKTYPLLEPLPSKAYDMATRFRPFAEEAWSSSMNWMDRLEKYGEKESTKLKDQDGKIYI
ncbi:MAG: CvpA family protein [Saprospiraceae bacterium]